MDLLLVGGTLAAILSATIFATAVLSFEVEAAFGCDSSQGAPCPPPGPPPSPPPVGEVIVGTALAVVAIAALWLFASGSGWLRFPGRGDAGPESRTDDSGDAHPSARSREVPRME